MENNINDLFPADSGSGKDKSRLDIERVNIALLFMIILPEVLLLAGVGRLLKTYVSQILFSQVVYAAPILFYLLFVKKNPEPCRFNKIRISTVFLCFLMYLCLLPVTTFLNAVSFLYSDNQIGDVMFNISSEVPYPVALLCAAILPAFFEELNFRGVVYNTYRKVNPFGAILMSGLLFGLLHGNLNQLTYTVFLGVIFALIVEATDSIFSTMIVHCLVNGFSTTMLYLLPKAVEYLNNLLIEAESANDTMTQSMLENLFGEDGISAEQILGGEGTVYTRADILASVRQAFIPALIGGILAFLLYRFIAKRCGRWEHICDIFRKREKTGRIFSGPLAVAVTLMFIIMILNELIARGIILS